VRCFLSNYFDLLFSFLCGVSNSVSGIVLVSVIEEKETEDNCTVVYTLLYLEYNLSFA